MLARSFLHHSFLSSNEEKLNGRQMCLSALTKLLIRQRNKYFTRHTFLNKKKVSVKSRKRERQTTSTLIMCQLMKEKRQKMSTTDDHFETS